MNSLINYAPGTSPEIQLSVTNRTSQKGTVVFMDKEGRTLAVTPVTNLTLNSPVFQCLSELKYVIMGPRSKVTILLNNQHVDFENGSFEHDLVFDTQKDVNSALLDSFYNLSGYNILDYGGVQYDGVILIPAAQNIVKSGSYRFAPPANVVNLTAFSMPSANQNYQNINNFDIIVGPYTYVTNPAFTLYNSGSVPLLYKNMNQASFNTDDIKAYVASPLASGYAKVNLINNTTQVMTNQNSPLIIMENLVNNIIVGPYTNVSIASSGRTKMYNNNTTRETSYILINNGGQLTINVSFSSGYIGFGFSNLTSVTYNVKPFDDVCRNINQPNPGPGPIAALPVSEWLKLNMDCNDRPIKNFEIDSDQNGFLNRFNCSNISDAQTETFNSDMIDLTSLKSLTELKINCFDRPLHSVNVIQDEQKIGYRYTCGINKLSNMNTYSTPINAGYFGDLNSVVGKIVDCGQQVLSGYELVTNPSTGDQQSFQFTYSCGDI